MQQFTLSSSAAVCLTHTVLTRRTLFVLLSQYLFVQSSFLYNRTEVALKRLRKATLSVRRVWCGVVHGQLPIAMHGYSWILAAGSLLLKRMLMGAISAHGHSAPLPCGRSSLDLLSLTIHDCKVDSRQFLIDKLKPRTRASQGGGE